MKGYQEIEERVPSILFRIDEKIHKDAYICNEEVIQDIIDGFKNHGDIVLKYLFYIRDPRKGLGKKSIFLDIIKPFLISQIDKPYLIDRILKQVPVFGRWDDLVEIYFRVYWEMDCSLIKEMIINIIKEQLDLDLKGIDSNESISLLGKWLPSANTSSITTCYRGKKLAKDLGYSQQKYRLILSKLRNHLNILERLMSDRRWKEIECNQIPSGARSKHHRIIKLLNRHNEGQYIPRGNPELIWEYANESRRYFWDSLPIHLIHRLRSEFYQDGIIKKSMASLELDYDWNRLPRPLSNTTTYCVYSSIDESSNHYINRTEYSPEDIMIGISTYFGRYLFGYFHNTHIRVSKGYMERIYIGFENRIDDIPAIVFSPTANKVIQDSKIDLPKILDHVLGECIRNYQIDVPDNILIMSSLPFEYGLTYSKMDLEQLCSYFEDNGIKIPNIIYWNLRPKQPNELSVRRVKIVDCLDSKVVKGVDINTIQKIMTGDLNPEKDFLHTIDNNHFTIHSDQD